MTRSFPNEPLWPRFSRVGTSPAAIWSSSSSAPSMGGFRSSAVPATPGAGPSAGRKPSRPRSPTLQLLARLRLGNEVGLGAPGVLLVELPQPLHPGEEPPLAVVEPFLDVEREDVAPAGGPDPERDRHRVVRFVADREGDPVHSELLGPGGGTAVEADRRLTRRQPLDLDFLPADAPDAEPE